MCHPSEATAKVNAAVVGTGAAGLATAASLAVAGHTVQIANRSPRGLDAIRDRGGVLVENSDGSGATAPVRAAASVADAVADSEVMVLAIGGGGEGELLRDLASQLSEVELVVVISGRAGAGPTCARALDPVRGRTTVVEMAFPFVASEEGPGAVRIHGRKSWTAVGCAPEDRGEWAAASLRSMFALEIELHPQHWPSLHCIPGLTIPLLAISNAGGIARGREFAFYRDGTFPEIDRLVDELDRERAAIGAKLGLSTISSVAWFNRTYGLDCASVSEVFATSPAYESRLAPDSLEHRYLTDHVPLCVVPIAFLGQQMGVATPLLRSIESIASGLVGRDLWSQGVAQADWIAPLVEAGDEMRALRKEDAEQWQAALSN